MQSLNAPVDFTTAVMHDARHTTALGSALVDYSSDSESDSTSTCHNHQERDRDRPAAASIMSLLPRPEASSVPPNGQWPVHIHVPLGQLSDRLADLLDKLLATARKSFPDIVSLVLPSSSPSSLPHALHISLSRAGTWLPRSQLAPCVGMIQADLAHLRPAQVQLGRVSHLVNDTGSRRFLVLECTAGQVGLARWLRVVDRVLEEQLGRQPFYEKPRFHVSIGYVDLPERAASGMPEDGQGEAADGDKRWDAVTGKLTLEFGKELAGCVLKLGRIEMRTGEQVYEVILAD